MSRRKGLVHRGLHHDRTKVKDALGRREEVFARAWEEENIVRQHGVRREAFPGVRCSTLQALMVKDGSLVPVSQETASAVATIVQWFATPIGFLFLHETLKKAGYRIIETKKKM